MTTDTPTTSVLDSQEPNDRVTFNFDLTRRQFVQVLGAGLLIAAFDAPVDGAQGRGGGGGGGRAVSARLHIARDGTITVLTGKVEGGQGARAQITQAAAEELRVAPSRINLIMGDTSLVPDDGITAGSRTTPSTLPAVRQGAAAARMLLVDLAARTWSVEPSQIELRDGMAVHAASGRSQSYADLASSDQGTQAFASAAPANVSVTPVSQWKVMGVSFPRPNRRDLVTGAHKYPSDIVRPGMLYGKVLRPPSYGARLIDVDLAPARAMEGVVAVRDGSFVGVAAPNTFLAQQALEAVAKTARWEPAAHPSSSQVYDYLRSRANVPGNPFAAELSAAATSLRQTYHVAYVQHAPMETRAAVAEWVDGRLTVWTASQNPFGVRGELMQAFRLGADRVRVIIPDFGGGFGGKHTGECAVEAARLAQAAGRPIRLQWTRQEEFTWAVFRPAAVIDIEAGLDARGAITSWHFININSGPAAVDSPYRIPRSRSQFVSASSPPLRHGSYRALAANANNFARECFMDELAAAAGRDPLEFRLAHLDNQRIRAVLEQAARSFDWPNRSKRKDPDVGVGLACGTEKGSVVATCVEAAINRGDGSVSVRRICTAFECGPIINPDNLRAQVVGCLIMALGPAIREETQFENGRITNATFSQYRVPRFEDVPELDIHLLNRPDIAPAGAGETPMIALAPAIANAVFHATGVRVRKMPIRLA